MKRIIIAGTGVIVVVAIGTALASAFSGRSGAYGLNTSASSMMPGSARSLYQLEVAALTSQGISQARAVEALNVQNEVWKADLVHKVEAALGNSYAGMWFDNASAELHIGVVSTPARRTVEGVVARAGITGHVVETPVRSSWHQLDAALKAWMHRLAGLLPRAQAVIGLSAPGNAVAITLAPSVPAAERATITHAAAHANVNVKVNVSPHPLSVARNSASSECNAFARGLAYCNKTLTSGVTIVPSTNPTKGNCTAGPMVIPRASKGETYLLTAGHCIGSYGSTIIANSKWYAFNRSKEAQEIGPAVEFSNATKGDVGLIKVNNPGYWVESTKEPVIANTAEWGTKNPETKYVVSGEGAFVSGAMVCHEGQTSGQTCGVQSKINPITTFTGGTETTENLVEVVSTGTLKCEKGDSGGPWLKILTLSNNEALMEGTEVGSEGLNPCYYEPLSKAYRVFPRNLELLTKGNENRAKDLEEEEKREKEQKEKEEKEKAGAMPGILPIGSLTGRAVGEPALIGKAILGSTAEVKCATAPSTGGFQTSLLGTFDILFSGCLVKDLVLLLCTGLNDTKTSSILVLGTFHLRYLNSEKKKAVIAYLLIPVHFTCVSGETEVLIEVRGCAAGEIGPVNKKVKASEHFVATLKKVSGTTRNEVTRILNEAGTAEETCSLESREGTNAFEPSAEETTEEITPNVESEIMT